MSKPILIMTALELEREAVNNHLRDLITELHPKTKTDYSVGEFKTENAEFKVIVGRTNQTNVNAALEVERAIGHFDPEYVFFVGVAGGLKDVAIGDIVIGENVYGFERGKAEEGNFKPRPQFGASGYEMERLANLYSQCEGWKEKAKTLFNEDFGTPIRVYSGTIASGEKVDASTDSDLHKFLKQNASHALAIEMEGLGFLEVCRQHPRIKSLLLRGISDLVLSKSEMDAKGAQPYASKNVAEFLFGIIGQLSNTERNELSIEQSQRQQFVEVMSKLYPMGLQQNGIWQNAGGNLALIQLSQTGKGQWVEAFRLLDNGGGGQITFQSLLAVVSEEFPSNDIKALIDLLPSS